MKQLARKKMAAFTLVELMIVVAIIGILAAVAIPKFGSMVRKSREAATAGNLGAIRSAITIYYGDMEGNYPAAFDALTAGQKYLSTIPVSWTYEYGSVTHVTYGP